MVGAGDCTTPQQQRQHTHTHWSSHISGEEQLALQQTQTDTHTTVLLTPLTHTPTTTPTPVPLGRPFMGEMVVMVSPAILALLDHPAYIAAIDLHYPQPPTTDTPTTTPTTLPPPSATTSGGVNDFHWGRTSCPTVHGTECVHDGITVGSHYTNT